MKKNQSADQEDRNPVDANQGYIIIYVYYAVLYGFCDLKLD